MCSSLAGMIETSPHVRHDRIISPRTTLLSPEVALSPPVSTSDMKFEITVDRSGQLQQKNTYRKLFNLIFLRIFLTDFCFEAIRNLIMRINRT